MIKITTYTSHPSAEYHGTTEITGVLVELLDDDEVLLEKEAVGFDGVSPPAKLMTMEAAGKALQSLKNKVRQVEEELRAMGLIP